MTDWRVKYRQALGRGREWLNDLRDGDHIFVGSAAGEPTTLIDQLIQAAQRDELPRLVVYQMLRGGAQRLLSVAGERLQVVGLIANEALDRLSRSGYASFLPTTIHQTARAIAERRLVIDVVILQVTPPDNNGHLSLGISADFALQACAQSRFIVAEVNDRLARTCGAFLQASKLSAAIETSVAVREVPLDAADEEARRIAKHVAELVPDGATIEIGVGAIMTAVLEALAGHRRLGLHTGLMIDPMVPLITQGAVTNEEKSIDRGTSVANQARGTSLLYDFLNDNPLVAMKPALYTHDHKVLTSLPAFRAINSAIEVDVLGQVNSEFLNGRRVSGTGGLADFVRAAHDSTNGRSIIALRSTAVQRSVSRIVSRLDPSAGVTLTADLADFVVTEHGVADLRGKDARARHESLIAVADPQFRDQLRAELGASARAGGSSS